jgi:hypothetical protein
MASTTFLDNQTVIYAAWLNDVNNAVYNGIFVSPSITATSMICNGTASGAGFTNLINNTFTAPGPIGSVTPSTGAFTTLSATGALSAASASFTAALPIASGGTGLTSAGTSGNVLTSNGTVWASSTNLAIGVGQSWTDLTSSRAFDTTYTNSTGKPIEVGVTLINTAVAGSRAYLVIDGIYITGAGASFGGTATGVTGIVPNGKTYSLLLDGGPLSIEHWAELR